MAIKILHESNMLSRKVVKQTVMTSVYGVTFIGARSQILERINDLRAPGHALEHVTDERFSYVASFYLAKVTLAQLDSLFKEARDIMKWLSDCAIVVAKIGQPMAWVTPLGLPVVQPYRNKQKYTLKTALQRVTLTDHNDLIPVSSVRQKSAFPPNFVHSLDSTHMVS